jgi:hypothetical protein
MCLRRAPEKYIAGAALDRAGLDYRLTDGKIVSPTHRPRSTPQEALFFCVWHSFLSEAEYTPGSSAAGRKKRKPFHLWLVHLSQGNEGLWREEVQLQALLTFSFD